MDQRHTLALRMNRDCPSHTESRSSDLEAAHNEHLTVPPEPDTTVFAASTWIRERSLSLDVSPFMPRRQSSRIALACHEDSSKPSRRVCFAMFEGGDGRPSPVQQVHMYPPIPQKMYADCFWSISDTHKMRNSQLEMVNQCRGNPSNKLSAAVLCLYGYARKRGAQDEHFDVSQNEAVRALVESNCRGLEYYMADRVSEHRCWGVTMVLAMQERYMIQDPEHVDVYLRSFYLKVSAPATRFARMIAKGDEEFVKNEINGKSHVATQSIDSCCRGLKNEAV